MRFMFTARIPSRSGGTVQTIVGDHPAASVDALAAELNAKDFIVVDEVWLNHDGGQSGPGGQVVLARRAIAKVKPWTPRRFRGDEAAE